MSDTDPTDLIDSPEAVEPVVGLYQIFGTDQDLEKKGFALEYGPVTVIIARSGGTNTRFARCLERKSRPHRNMINAGTFPESQTMLMMAEAYAETIILGWEGVTDREGVELEFTKENVVRVLLDLPDFFQEIQNESGRIANFITQSTEEDAKP